MKEKPILFTTEMIQAIRDGRKTQTRRVVKLPKPHVKDAAWVDDWRERAFFDAGCLGGPCLHVPCADEHDEYVSRVRSRYEVGDRLWVKERWTDHTHGSKPRWRSPLFMPKFETRIWLEVIRVRAERVQDITEIDAGREGVMWDERTARVNFADLWDSINGKPKPIYSKKEIVAYQSFPWSGESGTFEHRGLPHYVQANPWVWVYDFRSVGK